ncbi:MAG: FAD-dependent oxidoreductase [Candidatus Babeliales bacterium]
MKNLILCLVLFRNLLGNVDYLEVPSLKDTNILAYKAGVRPYRKTGIRLEAEWYNKKLLIHNYGHGGAGLTLSWGSAQEVFNILNQEINAHKELDKEKTIAIIGGGIVGLCVADILLEHGYSVKMYAEKKYHETTSNVAAGFFGAFSVAIADDEDKKQQFDRILKWSEKKLLELYESEDQCIKGITYTDFYIFNTENEQDTVHFSNGMEATCRKKNKFIMKGPLYLESIFNKVAAHGAQIIEKRFDTLNDILGLPESIIINCTGMGAKILFNDPDLIGIKGHLVHIEKNNFDVLIGNDGTDSFFIMPWEDRLVLGSRFVQEYDNDSCEIDIEQCCKVLELARKFFNTK